MRPSSTTLRPRPSALRFRSSCAPPPMRPSSASITRPLSSRPPSMRSRSSRALPMRRPSSRTLPMRPRSSRPPFTWSPEPPSRLRLLGFSITASGCPPAASSKRTISSVTRENNKRPQGCNRTSLVGQRSWLSHLIGAATCRLSWRTRLHPLPSAVLNLDKISQKA